jgi:integrase
MLRNLGAAMGALARADVYTNSPVPVVLAWSPAWRDAMRAARLKANEAQPDPPAFEVEHFRKAVKSAMSQKRVDLAALLILTFSTGARASDVIELARDEIGIQPEALMVQFKRGKGVKFRGPYTVHGAIADAEHRRLLTEYLNTCTTRWAWHAPTPQQRVALTGDLLALIRSVGGPAMRQSSIRRGALQRMATLGASEEDLMHFSGHTNTKTLRRYLGWNKVSATAGRTQALGARHTAAFPAS